MDNQKNPNSSVTLSQTPPAPGPFPLSTDTGNLVTTTVQSAPNLTPSPVANIPEPNTPLSSMPNWPPAAEPVISSVKLNQSNPSSFPPPSWPQETSSNSQPAGLGNNGLDLNSAWNPPVNAAPTPTPPEHFQTPPSPEPAATNPWLNPQSSTDPLSPAPISNWQPPIQNGSVPFPQPESSQPLVQPEPDLPQPDLPLARSVSLPREPNPQQINMDSVSVQPEPIPTFTPSAPSTLPITSPSDNTSETNPQQPSWMTDAQTSSMPYPPAEAAPTDLSHLISSNNNQQDSPQVPPAENLVVPTAGAIPEVPNLPAEIHKGIPKWLIGLGVGLLIIVAAASAYFILGIGQSKTTTSLPATTTSQNNQIKPPLPLASVPAQPAPSPSSLTATGSANFGQLGGSPPATSAADLIRQKQQGR